MSLQVWVAQYRVWLAHVRSDNRGAWAVGQQATAMRKHDRIIVHIDPPAHPV